ncbi:tripartite motif-containing protein 45-like [Patella vulgata]|uniref:tripartite motif-containing protein 45-like n=1 Tax=Patella vulgata TaxID=6465 RepID=UPI0024A9E5E7|nr:tripartite motif-containing protein 45-like [Patella vulgata]
MAEQNNKELCSICLSDFNQPKIIDCNHTFCFTCLDDYVNKTATNNHFICPLCRCNIEVPVGGVRKFTSKLTTVLNSETNVLQCDVCANSSSMFSCKDCQQSFCVKCRILHDKLKACKDHNVTRICEFLVVDLESKRGETISDEVTFRHQIDQQFYCDDCSLVVDNDSRNISHSTHRIYDCNDADVKREAKEELKVLNEQLKIHIDKLETFSKCLELKYAVVKDTIQGSCNMVDRQVDKICAEVRRIGETLKDEMRKTGDEALNDRCKSEFGKLKWDTKILTENLKASVEYSTNILRDPSIVSVLKRIPLARREREKHCYKQLELPDMKYVLFEEQVLDKAILTKQIGRLISCQGSRFESSFAFCDVGTWGVYYGSEKYVWGLPWCIGVMSNTNKPGPSLMVSVKLGQLDDPDILSCRANFIIELLNPTENGTSVVEEVNNCQFTPARFGEYWFNSRFVDWNKFRYGGFLVHSQFKITVTFKKIVIRRRKTKS